MLIASLSDTDATACAVIQLSIVAAAKSQFSLLDVNSLTSLALSPKAFLAKSFNIINRTNQHYQWLSVQNQQLQQ